MTYYLGIQRKRKRSKHNVGIPKISEGRAADDLQADEYIGKTNEKFR